MQQDLLLSEFSALSAEAPLILDLDAVIHRHIHLVLGLNHGNKLKTARQLGISRSTLYRLLENEAAAQR